MTAKIKSASFPDSLANTSCFALFVTIVLSSKVGNCAGGHHRDVCHRTGWFLHGGVHVQLQPRSPVYPLLIYSNRFLHLTKKKHSNKERKHGIRSYI